MKLSPNYYEVDNQQSLNRRIKLASPGEDFYLDNDNILTVPRLVLTRCFPASDGTFVTGVIRGRQWHDDCIKQSRARENRAPGYEVIVQNGRHGYKLIK